MAQRSKREDIATAAVECFHAHGFHATSVRDVTAAAGAPVGSFYNHFETKDDLAIEVIRRYAGSGNNLLADRSLPPLERLRRHFELFEQENVARDFARGCLLGNFTAEVGDHSPRIRAAVSDAFTAWAQGIAGVLAEAREDGTLRAGLEPEPTARFILAAWEGALIESRARQSADAFANFSATVFGVLLSAAPA
jgi:TetR/AcrR family transcriptional repressor of nem operon